MTFGNDKKELRKGERLMVTIEEVLHDTLLVFLEYRRAKFCGVLLNTSNRRGPFGLQDQPENHYYRAYDIDPTKLENEEKNEAAPKKTSTKVSFPHMLDMRTTYGQNAKLPPPRQIYMKRRRSKRKVRMDMIGTDDAIRIAMGYSGRKLLSHHATCCCDTCAARGLQELSKEDNKSTKGKRKLISEESGENRIKAKKGKWVDGVAPLSSISKRPDTEKKAGQSRTEKSEKKDGDQPLKRSPVIKISYKSPGGKGRVLKIPSRLHHSSGADKSGKNSNSVMHEIARKVVHRAKTEHYKYVHEQKSATPKRKKNHAPNKVLAKKKDSSTAPSKSPEKPTSRNTRTPPKLHKSSPLTNQSLSSAKNDAAKKALFPEKPSLKKGAEDMPEKRLASTQVSPRRRESRNLHPHVLLQPLTSDDAKDETATGGAAANTQATAPSQHTVKSKLDAPPDDGTVADEANLHAMGTSQSSAVGTSGNEEKPLKRDKSKASHSLSVTRCTTAKGVQWCQGDVVWGKILGFPWWPGLIRKIVVKKEDGKVEQVAIVDWFQSKTVSHIPCQVLEGFSECYTKRYDRKRKGKYRNAIRDAREAEKKMSPEVRKLIVQFET